MAPRNPYNVYAQNKVFSASNEELTLMLYDGAVRFSKVALEAMHNREVEKAHIHIVKVQNIILEFQMTLNRTYPISKDFDAMYALIDDKIAFADRKQDKVVLEECVGLLEEMRDTWKEAMIVARQQRGTAGIPVVN